MTGAEAQQFQIVMLVLIPFSIIAPIAMLAWLERRDRDRPPPDDEPTA